MLILPFKFTTYLFWNTDNGLHTLGLHNFILSFMCFKYICSLNQSTLDYNFLKVGTLYKNFFKRLYIREKDVTVQ